MMNGKKLARFSGSERVIKVGVKGNSTLEASGFFLLLLSYIYIYLACALILKRKQRKAKLLPLSVSYHFS